MDFKDFTAARDDSDRRLNKVVLRIFEAEKVQNNIFPLIRKGLIKVNGKKTSAEYKVQENDVIQVAAFLLHKDETSATENESKAKKVFPFSLEQITVFRNEHILIVNKPAGVNVQPAKDCPFCLCDLIEEDFNGKKGTSISFRPGPLHRIDRWTSGLVAFSQSSEGAKWFTENIKNHSIKKQYMGITQGDYKNTEEKYVDLIYAPESSSTKYGTVVCGGTDGKNAITYARFIKKTEIQGIKCNVVSFDIETGRKHQIRAQSAFHAHPLLGDTAYGGTKLNGKMFFLHAFKLTFPANPLGLPEEIMADCPFLQ